MNKSLRYEKLSRFVVRANTGLDAIKRAPIVEHDSGTRCLRIQDISQKKEFQKWGFCKVNDRDRDRFLLKKNDLIIARTGETIGSNLIIREDLESVYNNGLIRLNLDLHLADPKYISFCIASNHFSSFIDNVARTTSTQPNIKINVLLDYLVPFPSLETQKKIAAILSAYDDLIEINKQRIALLEKMAEEIYREWFVRFRFPGWQNTEFEKGIPKDWETVSLENYCEKVTDGTHDTPKPSESGHLLITGKNIKNFQIDFSDAYFISENDYREISRRSGLKEGDILYSNIGTVGQIAIVEEKVDYSVKNVIIFRAYNTNESLFLFHLLKNTSVSENLLARSSGSSQQFIGLRTARNFEILKPRKSLLELFGKTVNPLFKQRKLLIKSNEVLNASRSCLLPRLISGKLSVENLDIEFPLSMQ